MGDKFIFLRFNGIKYIYKNSREKLRDKKNIRLGWVCEWCYNFFKTAPAVDQFCGCMHVYWIHPIVGYLQVAGCLRQQRIRLVCSLRWNAPTTWSRGYQTDKEMKTMRWIQWLHTASRRKKPQVWLLVSPLQSSAKLATNQLYYWWGAPNTSTFMGTCVVWVAQFVNINQCKSFN